MRDIYLPIFHLHMHCLIIQMEHLNPLHNHSCSVWDCANRKDEMVLLSLLPVKPNLQLLYEGLKSVNEGTDSSVLKSSLQMSFNALQEPRKELCLFQSNAQALFLPEFKQTEKNFSKTANWELWVMMDE